MPTARLRPQWHSTALCVLFETFGSWSSPILVPRAKFSADAQNPALRMSTHEKFCRVDITGGTIMQICEFWSSFIAKKGIIPLDTHWLC